MVHHTFHYWSVLIVSEYNGMQTGAKHVSIGPLIPTATNEELQSWKNDLREQGLTQEDINKGNYAMVASAYVRLDASRWIGRPKEFGGA